MSRFRQIHYLINSALDVKFKIVTKSSNALNSLYIKIAGAHPRTNALHHQWAMNRQLLKFSKNILEKLPSDAYILDVGVGSAPYWSLREDVNWIGLDVISGPNVTHIINKDLTWPVKTNSIDYVLCTQVIEHVENPTFLVNEIERVLKPGGMVILNAPFLYPFHGMPDDQLRYTTTQLRFLFQNFRIEECGILGKVGSSIATLWLNYVNNQITKSKLLKFLKVVLFPIWLAGNALINIVLVSVDKFDSTDSFPLNTYIIATLPQRT